MTVTNPVPVDTNFPPNPHLGSETVVSGDSYGLTTTGLIASQITEFAQYNIKPVPAQTALFSRLEQLRQKPPVASESPGSNQSDGSLNYTPYQGVEQNFHLPPNLGNQVVPPPVFVPEVLNSVVDLSLPEHRDYVAPESILQQQQSPAYFSTQVGTVGSLKTSPSFESFEPDPSGRVSSQPAPLTDSPFDPEILPPVLPAKPITTTNNEETGQLPSVILPNQVHLKSDLPETRESSTDQISSVQIPRIIEQHTGRIPLKHEAVTPGHELMTAAAAKQEKTSLLKFLGGFWNRAFSRFNDMINPSTSFGQNLEENLWNTP